MPKIGVQAMMLRDYVKTDGVKMVWQRLGELGFSSVEVSQIPLTDSAVHEIAESGAEFGIEVAALSAGMGPGPNDSLLEHLDKIVADCKVVGTDRVRIGMMPLTAMESYETLVAFAREVEEKTKALADQGIRLYYHNHHIEFARCEHRHLLDIIRAEAPSLRFELDVHWIHRGGLDPVKVLADYAGVVDLVHLKDYRIGLPSPEMFAALASGDRSAHNDYWASAVQFAEIGAGNLDFGAIIEQGIASGAEHLLIEQDDQYGRDIFDCLADSRKNLVDLGYESLL